jgi:CHASE1-domain containing sensor protein
MGTLTIQRRTISIPAKEVKCKLKWTDTQRTPRKLKKRLKKKFGVWWRAPQIISPLLKYENRRCLITFLEPSKHGK